MGGRGNILDWDGEVNTPLVKKFSDSLSRQIFGHMHKTLNINKKN
jgi:hypothetical protein